MPNPLLMAAARSPRARRLLTSSRVTRRVVDRFVAGEDDADALAATRALVEDGLAVTLDHLGEGTVSEDQADAVLEAYLAVLARLAEERLTPAAEVSVKLSALGLTLPDGEQQALRRAGQICRAAAAAGTTVTVDMEDHTTVDATLRVVAALRRDFPWVGAVLQSCLRRTEQDCRDLSGAGSRVRLVKGAYDEPATVAHRARADVDAAFDRCLQILLTGQGYPMVATHDPALIARAEQLVRESGRDASSYELQMLFGIRSDEQRRLAAAGHRVRVYVAYGDDWYGYFMRRLAERPANVLFFLRALVSREREPAAARTAA